MKLSLQSSETGLALVIVLWVVASLALLVAGFNATVRVNVAVAGNGIVSAKSMGLITAGVNLAVARLVFTDPEDAWQADGRVREVVFAGRRLAISINDANGRIDINHADAELLRTMFATVTGSPRDAKRLTDRIIDWRDADSNRRPNGAEDDDYRRENRTPLAADAPFVNITQLQQVAGVTPEIYRRVRPLLTVFGRGGKINPMTASQAVLAAVPGIDAATARRAIELRTGTPDDRDGVLEQLSAGGKWLQVRNGPAYVIELSVLRPDGTPLRTDSVTVLVNADNKAPYRVIEWRPESRPAPEPKRK